MYLANHKFMIGRPGGQSLLRDTSSDPLPRWLRNRSRGTLLLIRKTLLVVILNQLIICQIWAVCASISSHLYCLLSEHRGGEKDV